MLNVAVSVPYPTSNVADTAYHHVPPNAQRHVSEPPVQEPPRTAVTSTPTPTPTNTTANAAALPEEAEMPRRAQSPLSVDNDDDESDYYQLRRKPEPRNSQRRSMRPVSANEPQQPKGNTRKEQGAEPGATRSSKGSRPTSAPFDRVETEHTYRTKHETSREGRSSGNGSKRVAPVRGSTPVRNRQEAKAKPLPQNILLPGGIYTTGLTLTSKSQSSKRVQPSGSSSDRQAHTVPRSESLQQLRPTSRGGTPRGSGSVEYTYNAHGHREKKRPSSSGTNRPLGAGGRPLSMYERNKLNQMYDAGVLDQLDDAIMGVAGGGPPSDAHAKDGRLASSTREDSQVPRGGYELYYDRR